MRPAERIPIVLKYIDWKKFLGYYLVDMFNQVDFPIFLYETVKRIKTNKAKIKKYWKQNPDERLTQVLVNMGLISNYPGMWYYIEEMDYLSEIQKIPNRELLLWGTYGKDGKSKLKYVLLKNMSNEHIKAILKTQKTMKESYKKAFKKELNYRKKNNIIIDD